MPPFDVETFPVFCDHNSVLNDRKLEKEDDDWIEKHKSPVCESFREAGGRDWVSQLVAHWNLDSLSLAELAELLGISIAQASRLRNHFSSSIGVLGQWAARHGHPLPAPKHERWSMYGLSAALQTTHWLNNVTATRRNRTPLPTKTPEHEIHLFITLFSGRSLAYDWHKLTRRFEPDLYRAAADKDFLKFLKDVRRAFLRLTQNLPSARNRYQIYFPQGQLFEESRWELCRDIDSLWQKVHLDGRRTWAAVDGLTPWLTGLIDEDDDEAA